MCRRLPYFQKPYIKVSCSSFSNLTKWWGKLVNTRFNTFRTNHIVSLIYPDVFRKNLVPYAKKCHLQLVWLWLNGNLVCENEFNVYLCIKHGSVSGLQTRPMSSHLRHDTWRKTIYRNLQCSKCTHFEIAISDCLLWNMLHNTIKRFVPFGKLTCVHFWHSLNCSSFLTKKLTKRLMSAIMRECGACVYTSILST